MIDITKTAKKDYVSLRKMVREHISVNSRILADNREKFYRNEKGKKFIVGGVVLNKKIVKRCYYRDKSSRWNSWNYFTLEEVVKKPELLSSVEFVSTRGNVELCDFSGVFSLTFDRADNADCIDLAKVKEGDIVYAISKGIFPYRVSPEFAVKGERLLSLDEVVRLKNGDLIYSREEVDREFYEKNEIKDICNSSRKKDIWYESEFGEDPMSIIRFFLKKEDNFNNADYLFLFDTLERAYRKCPIEKMANIVTKCYKLWYNSQNWEGVPEKSRREDFYVWFPDLRGVVPEKAFN